MTGRTKLPPTAPSNDVTRVVQPKSAITAEQFLAKLRSKPKKRRVPRPVAAPSYDPATGRLVLPLALQNELKASGAHWRVRHERSKRQHKIVRDALAFHSVPKPTIPCVVTITRVAPATLDPGDNCTSCGKYVRDAIAAWLGIDDKHDHLVRYEVLQRRGKPYACEVEFRSMRSEVA